MWRVQGFVGRVLHRCHGNVPLRLSQTHHVEDEVINSSNVLSTSRYSSDSSSQKEEDGEKKKKQRTFQFDYTRLPRYTALDAVGWGAAAALFMQLCRRIHSQLSSGGELSQTPGPLTSPSTLHKCGYRILLETLSRRDVLPRRKAVLCLPGKQNEDQSAGQSSSSSSSSSSSNSRSSDDISLNNIELDHKTAGHSFSNQQRALLNHDSHLSEESLQSASCPLQHDTKRDGTKTQDAKNKDMLSDEERLVGAALNLRNAGDTSIPVILNIMGLESAKHENHEEAFICFLAAAHHGYHKAQFNTGVCYEKGRGVAKNTEKALNYYHLAAAGGHRQAQYRYAKLLLTNRGHQSLDELNQAISLLEQAAAAGHNKAQVCLASVYCQEPVSDERKSMQYLKMAAESGDDMALLFLGQCFENGFGVQQNLRTSIKYYKQAAQAGNKKAKSLLTTQKCTDRKAEDAALRSIRSAPCFFVADPRIQQPLSSLSNWVPPSTRHPVTLPVMPHSWSTGSLCVPPGGSHTPVHLFPQSLEGGTCQWTVGI